MTTTRTPGPWKRLGKMIVGGFRTGDDGGKQGDVVCTMRGSVDYKNIDGNSRLIALAPDLLEGCTEAERLLSLPFNHPDHNGATFEGAAKTLRTIVGKIEGRKVTV